MNLTSYLQVVAYCPGTGQKEWQWIAKGEHSLVYLCHEWGINLDAWRERRLKRSDVLAPELFADYQHSTTYPKGAFEQAIE